jgi:hypothetical protein
MVPLHSAVDKALLPLLQVSETAQEPIPEEKDNINAVHSLSQEATFINQNFSQQVVTKVRPRTRACVRFLNSPVLCDQFLVFV